jgi:hypothetical protein
MIMERAQEYKNDRREIGGVSIDVMTYKIGDRYFCHVSNTDPGATVARAEADTREMAEQLALTKAKNRLGVKAS